MDIKQILEQDNLELFLETFSKQDYSESIGINGRNWFLEAAYYGSEKILKTILEKNPNLLNTTDKSGNPAIYFSILKDKPQVFNFLINQPNIDFNINHTNGRSLSMNVALLKNKNEYLIRLLNTGLVNLDYTFEDKNIHAIVADINSTLAAQIASQSLGKSLDTAMANPNSNVQDIISNLGNISSLQNSSPKLTPNMTPNKSNNPSAEANPTASVTIDPSHLTQEQLLQELIHLGFENISELGKHKEDIVGREQDVAEISKLLTNNQNVIITGQDGLGKSTIVSQISQHSNKTILKIPPALLKGNQYVNSTNEKINTWLPLLLQLENSVLFVDDMEILNSGATEKNQNDTPLSILKNYLKPNGSKKIQMIGTINDSNYTKIHDTDEGLSFLTLFYNGVNSGFSLDELSLEETKKILLSPNTISNLKANGLSIDNPDQYPKIVEQVLQLTDSFIFNQKFPFKGFDFLTQIISKNDLSSLTTEKIQDEFSSKYNVPIEYIKGYLPNNSKYLNLESELKKSIIGQNPAIEEVSEAIANNITRSSPKDRNPLSMFFMGPTGVGKSEIANIIQQHLGYEVLTLNCSEFIGASKVTDFIDTLKEHVKKHYNGIIILDEIEKGDERLGNVLLALGEGKIGSGKDMVYCGNQIIIATSNVGAPQISKDKRFAHENGLPDFNLPKEELKQILLDSKKFQRPEVLGRFDNFVSFSPIYTEVARTIAYNVTQKEKDSQLKNRNIELVIPHNVIDLILSKKFNEVENEKSGARGIKNIISELVGNIFPTIESKQLKISGAKAELQIDKDGNVISKITPPNGETKTFTVMAQHQKTKEEMLKELRELQAKAIEKQATSINNSNTVKPT